MAQPKVEVNVVQKAPKKHGRVDLEFTKPRPENLGEFAEHPTIKRLLALSRGRSDIAIEATQDMGHLDKDARSTWPTNVELAKRRTVGRRGNMTKWELALWEAHRSPETGVPPANVVSPGPGQEYIVEN